MNRPIVLDIDIDNNTEVYREMTDSEYAQYLIDLEQTNLESQKQQEAIQMEQSKNNAKREALRLVGLAEDAIDAILN